MATYTNTETFARDFAPTGASENFPRIVARAARMAYNYINARLSGAYSESIPFSTTPPMIEDVSDMLTRAWAQQLQGGRIPAKPKAMRSSSGVLAVKDDDALVRSAVEMLEDIAAGRVVLLDSSGVEITRDALTAQWTETI